MNKNNILRSRSVREHKILTAYFDDLSDARGSDRDIKRLREICQYIERKSGSVDVDKITHIPKFKPEFLEKMYDVICDNVTPLLGDKIDERSVSEYKKKVDALPHTLEDIKSLLELDMVSFHNAKPELKDALTKLIEDNDIHRNAIKIGRFLSKDKIGDILIGSGMLVGTLAVLLKVYLVALVAIGLIVVGDIIHLVKEDADNSPYDLIGSYPDLEVNRSEDYHELTIDDIHNYDANNLLELLKQLHMFQDDLQLHMSTDELNKIHRSRDGVPRITKDLQEICPLISHDNIRMAKDLIVRLAEKYDNPDEFSYVHTDKEKVEFALDLECGIQNVISIFRQRMECNRELVDYGAAISMFETLCLLVWESFIKHISEKDIPTYKNQYLTMEMTDETVDVIQYYNNLFLTRETADPNITLANSILRSASSKYVIEDATVKPAQQSSGTNNQQNAPNFNAQIQPYLKGRQQLSEKALPWVQKNVDEIKQLGSLFWNEDSVTMPPYTYNLQNVQNAITLLTNIQNFLTTGYFQNRDQNSPHNINNLINQLFPTVKSDNAINATVLANTIATGRGDQPQNTTISGGKLQSTYQEMLNMLTDQKVVGYYQSDVLMKLGDAVKNFSAKQKQANVTPPKVNNTQQQTTPTQQNASVDYMSEEPQGTQQQPVTSQQAPIDQMVLNHASSVVIAVIGILQKMTNDAYNVIASYYPILQQRQNGQQQQNTQQPNQQ